MSDPTNIVRQHTDKQDILDMLMWIEALRDADDFTYVVEGGGHGKYAFRAMCLDYPLTQFVRAETAEEARAACVRAVREIVANDLKLWTRAIDEELVKYDRAVGLSNAHIVPRTPEARARARQRYEEALARGE